jgi:hypothetical protein
MEYRFAANKAYPNQELKNFEREPPESHLSTAGKGEKTRRFFQRIEGQCRRSLMWKKARIKGVEIDAGM